MSQVPWNFGGGPMIITPRRGLSMACSLDRFGDVAFEPARSAGGACGTATVGGGMLLDEEVADRLLGLRRQGRAVATVDGAGW